MNAQRSTKRKSVQIVRCSQEHLTLFLDAIREIRKLHNNVLPVLPPPAYRAAIDKGELYIAVTDKRSKHAIGTLLCYAYKLKSKRGTFRIRQVGSLRAGVGRALMVFAEQRARDSHCLQMILDVRQDNTNAIQFYQHLGFRTVEKQETVFVMTKRVEGV